MNNQTRQALEMAQEVLNLYCEQLNSKFANDALKAIDEALSQEPSDWIEWHGGEQPVSDNTMVEVEFKDGFKFKYHADDLDWYSKDIIRYRIAKEQL